MGEIRKVDVSLSDELITQIDDAIADGDYAGLDEVVGTALKLWAKKRERKIAELRTLIEEGLASGEPVPGNFDVEEIRRRGMERLTLEMRS